MKSEGTEDPELEAIRARRRAELLSRKGPTPGSAQGWKPLVELTSETFPAFLTDNPRSVVDVWAPWCEPCRTMAPVLETLARELAPNVSFAKLNADDEPALAGRWNVEGIPTLLVFERGRLIDRVVGAQPHEALADRLRGVYRLESPSLSEA